MALGERVWNIIDVWVCLHQRNLPVLVLRKALPGFCVFLLCLDLLELVGCLILGAMDVILDKIRCEEYLLKHANRWLFMCSSMKAFPVRRSQKCFRSRGSDYTRARPVIWCWREPDVGRLTLSHLLLQHTAWLLAISCTNFSRLVQPVRLLL